MGKLVFPDVQIELDELRCPCCQGLPPELYNSVYWNNLLYHWQDIRAEWGKSIKISRGWSCPKHIYYLVRNLKTDACLSPHSFGALDNDLENEEEVLKFVDLVDKKNPQMRIGFRAYLDKKQTFVHLDECYLIHPRPAPSWIEGFRW